jgi:hypothetical protein
MSRCIFLSRTNLMGLSTLKKFVFIRSKMFKVYRNYPSSYCGRNLIMMQFPVKNSTGFDLVKHWSIFLPCLLWILLYSFRSSTLLQHRIKATMWRNRKSVQKLFLQTLKGLSSKLFCSPPTKDPQLQLLQWKWYWITYCLQRRGSDFLSIKSQKQ